MTDPPDWLVRISVVSLVATLFFFLGFWTGDHADDHHGDPIVTSYDVPVETDNAATGDWTCTVQVSDGIVVLLNCKEKP